MTFSIRTLAAALAFAVAGIAQAGEISDAPVPMSTKSRAEVAAEARKAPSANELYDGNRPMAAHAASKAGRETMRAAAPRMVAADLFVGGM